MSAWLPSDPPRLPCPDSPKSEPDRFARATQDFATDNNSVCLPEERSITYLVAHVKGVRSGFLFGTALARKRLLTPPSWLVARPALPPSYICLSPSLSDCIGRVHRTTLCVNFTAIFQGDKRYGTGNTQSKFPQ